MRGEQEEYRNAVDHDEAKMLNILISKTPQCNMPKPWPPNLTETHFSLSSHKLAK
jgi:hypothetical protein